MKLITLKDDNDADISINIDCIEYITRRISSYNSNEVGSSIYIRAKKSSIRVKLKFEDLIDKINNLGGDLKNNM